MTQKHTDGPWVVFEEGGIIGVTPSGQNRGKGDVAHFSGFDSARTLEEERANARLSAAAPELLEALVSVMGLQDNTSPFGGELQQDRIDRALDAARAAIAKATGESQ